MSGTTFSVRRNFEDEPIFLAAILDAAKELQVVILDTEGRIVQPRVQGTYGVNDTPLGGSRPNSARQHGITRCGHQNVACE
jgi:hypothetical protein